MKVVFEDDGGELGTITMDCIPKHGDYIDFFPHPGEKREIKGQFESWEVTGRHTWVFHANEPGKGEDSIAMEGLKLREVRVYLKPCWDSPDPENDKTIWRDKA